MGNFKEKGKHLEARREKMVETNRKKGTWG